MLPLERQNKILDILTDCQAVSVEELCRLLYSSGATIRRDLAVLENGGMLRRTHGGAVIADRNVSDFPLTLRENENLGPKNVIAQNAVSLIRDGQTIFLDASSTVFRMAERINGFTGLRIITNGLKIADTLSKREGIEVYCTGGRIWENNRSLIGIRAQQFASNYYADLAFFSCRGVSPDAGATESNEEEAALKRIYLKNSRYTVLLADSSKLQKRFFCRICGLSELSELISDIPLDSSYQTGSGRDKIFVKGGSNCENA